MDQYDDNVMKSNDHDEDGVFDDLSHKWQNFVERGAEILGFDADRFEKVKDQQYDNDDSDNWLVNFMQSCGVKKATLVTIAQFLITFYFIADAWNIIMDRTALDNQT